MMEFTAREFRIKRLDRGDIQLAKQLIIVFDEVFNVEKSNPPKKTYLKKLLKNNSFICFAAIYKNEVTGGLTAYELPMYNEQCSEIYIYDIAVKPAFQRMGVGSKLLSAVKEYAIKNGIKVMFVDANEIDKHALDFYRSSHASEEKVIQFTYNDLKKWPRSIKDG